MLPSCREVSRLMSEGDLDDAPLSVRFLAGLHLLICKYCRLYRSQLRLIRAAARHWARGLADPAGQPALESRIIRRLAG